MAHEYPRILQAFYGTPWAIWPPKLAEIRHVLMTRARGERITDEEIQAVIAARRDQGQQMAGRVAVVSVFGVLCQRMGSMDEASGGVAYDRIGSVLDALVADKQCKSILMVMDSPGGTVIGCDELADKIRGYRGQKKVNCAVDGMCASAAYYIASQCAEISCTPTGMVGSIGTISAHEDISGALEAQGVKLTMITAGKYKGEGSPYEPLSEEARQEIQSKVDHYYGQFVEAVAKGRDTTAAKVKANYGQGRMLTPADAKAAGMIDRVCTVAEQLERMGAYEGTAPARAENDDSKIRAARRKLDIEFALGENFPLTLPG